MLLSCFIIMCMFFAMSVVLIGAKIKDKYFHKGWRRKIRIICPS